MVESKGRTTNRRKRRRRLPVDWLVLIIIAELSAVCFSGLEIINESTARITGRATDSITVSCMQAIYTPTEYVDTGIEEYAAYIEELNRWKGPVLSKNKGVVYGPSGKETYYNLNMNTIVRIMRSMGNTDEYWVREDGCKMLGEYIMVAANLNLRPRGTIVETSLGKGIVCDTGGFAKRNPTQIDIATTW